MAQFRCEYEVDQSWKSQYRPGWVDQGVLLKCGIEDKMHEWFLDTIKGAKTAVVEE